jgi:hypothetical protein
MGEIIKALKALPKEFMIYKREYPVLQVGDESAVFYL